MRIHPSVFPLFDEHLLARCFYYLLRQEFGQNRSQNIRGIWGFFTWAEQRLGTVQYFTLKYKRKDGALHRMIKMYTRILPEGCFFFVIVVAITYTFVCLLC